MSNIKHKLFLYKITFVLLIIAALVFLGIILKKQYNDKIYEDENNQVVMQFSEILNNNNAEKKENIQIEMQGYKVIGLIKIPTIDLEYPILEKTTQETMNMSISKFYGNSINELGNVSLAGHNNYNGTMFGKNNKLVIGDSVYLTSLDGTTIEYKVYDIFSTDPNDTSILETEDETVREVTLITCKNGRSSRLIIKAREVSNID